MLFSLGRKRLYIFVLSGLLVRSIFCFYEKQPLKDLLSRIEIAASVEEEMTFGYELVDAKAVELNNRKMLTIRDLREIIKIDDYFGQNSKTLSIPLSLRALEGLVSSEVESRRNNTSSLVNNFVDRQKNLWNVFDQKAFEQRMKKEWGFSYASFISYATWKEAAVLSLTQLRHPIDPSDRVVIEILKQYQKDPVVEYDLESAILTSDEFSLYQKGETDLKWIKFGFQGASLAPEIVAVLEGLDDGQVSAPIKIDDGYRFLKVNRRVPLVSLDDEEKELVFKEVQSRWLKNVVEPYLPEVEANVVETVYMDVKVD